MSRVDLFDPHKKDIAMQLVSSAENSSLDWRAQYAYIEDIGDGRGYTAGIIGFCSGTGDMLELVELYTSRVPGNVLAKYLPALRNVNGTDSHAGLDPAFAADWRTAARDAAFQRAQNDERDRVYFNPSVNQAKADGLHALGPVQLLRRDRHARPGRRPRQLRRHPPHGDGEGADPGPGRRRGRPTSTRSSTRARPRC